MTWLIIVSVAIVAVCFFFAGTSNAPARTEPPSRPAPRRVTNPQPADRSQLSETGNMIYYANNRHGRRDYEYKFNYKKVNGAWRAYIIRMPDLNGRNGAASITHRLYDNGNAYVCWDTPLSTLKEAQIVSKKWADCLQEYIATGKEFG